MDLIWTVIYGFIVGVVSCQKNHRDKCCKYGEELAIQTSAIYRSTELLLCSTENIKEFIAGRDQTIRKTLTCSVLARSCCLKLVRSEVCRLAAMENDDCESIAPERFVTMTDIKLECCLCCQKTNPVSMDVFDNCNLLKGKCPEKHTKSIDISNDSGTTLSSYNATDAIDSTMTQQNVTDITDDLTYATTQTVTSDRVTQGADLTMPMTSVSSMTSDAIRAHLTTTTTITPTTPMLCNHGHIWDSRLQVCVQMIISCPQKFVLHPDSKRCVPVILPKVPCLSGYAYNQFKNKCLDIDECLKPLICINKTEICVNLNGSYKCECVAGFKENKMGICEDIDECSNSSICPEDKKCKNRIGSYRCVRAIPCGFGWKEDSETNECVDIDECESFPDICGVGMTCVNIRGSHKCEDEKCPNNMRRNNKGKCSRCRDGFRMSNTTNECEDIDECMEKAHFYKGRCKDSEYCLNMPGSYECVAKKKCRPGTLLTKNGTSCEDIDECKEMTFRCNSDDICINTYSAFQCVASPCAPSQYYDYKTQKCFCKEGYRQNSDTTCEDIDECNDSNVQCGSLYRCINKPGGYMCINKINCTKGMYRPSANSVCQDIDECETGEGKCQENMHCVNMVGSYKCMCDRGFIMLKNESCADINECLLFRPEESCPDLEARCVNTPGSYKCQCPRGFVWSDYPMKKCIDIDECQDKSNPCGNMHMCINIIGGYRCQCHPGYRLTLAGDKCEDIDECNIIPKKCVNGQCINIPGRYTCQCEKGFLPDNNEICQDIDECLNFQGMCAISGSFESSRRCINLLGYYKCVNNSCPMEYSQTQLGNGYMCMLNQKYHCELQNVDCLITRPYRRSLQFFEITPNIDLPRTLTRINVGHLPPGNQRISLQVKYAHHTDSKEPIVIQNAFRLSRGRSRNEEIEITLQQPIVAPAEVLLYLQTSVYHRDLYLGHSEAYMTLYFTRYPETVV